jgi:hypothetical protein
MIGELVLAAAVWCRTERGHLSAATTRPSVGQRPDLPDMQVIVRHLHIKHPGYPFNRSKLRAWISLVPVSTRGYYPRSTGEFQAWFHADADCLDYLEWLRWPDGFACPSCGCAGWRLGDGRFECGSCVGAPR